MNNHALRAHARFGASSAHRWFACPGSVSACEGVPDAPSAAALEGTRAHELLEKKLKGEKIGENGHDMSIAQWSEMWDAINVAVEYVRGILEDHPDAVMLVEHRFEIPVASAPGEVFGTNDVCVFVPSLRLLYVVDYKHGAGTFVEVKGNKQLRFYALGAIAARSPYGDEKGIRNFVLPELDTVAMVIVQPRCAVGEPVREEWVPVEEVLEFGKTIGEAVERCKAPDAPLVPGEEQCRFCAARTTCPARRQLLVDGAFGGVAAVNAGALPVPSGMDAGRLAGLVRIKAQALAFFGDVEDEARRRLEAGEALPGLKLVEAQARREWVDKDVDDIASALADIAVPNGGCNQDVVAQFVRRQPQTLGEVERVLKEGCDRAEARRRLDAMAFLTTKKSSGALKVARDDDPRPAARRADAAFGDVAQIEHVKE